MNPENLLELIKERVKFEAKLPNDFLEDDASLYVRRAKKGIYRDSVKLYEQNDLISDVYLSVYEKTSDQTPLEDIKTLIKNEVNRFSFVRYKAKRNPLNYSEELTNTKKELPNENLEAILIKEAKERLSSLIDLYNI